MFRYKGANWRQESIWLSVRERDVIIVSLEAKIIQKLSSRRACGLKVPCLVECCMMALFNNARIQIQVNNVLISSCVSKEDAGEVMAVQFGTPIPRTFDTYS